jgi:hypothetical protein
MSLKNTVTPRGIDPGTIRLVTQQLNHYATAGPSCQNKFVKLVPLVGFIIKKFVTMQHGHTMHGHTKVNFIRKFVRKILLSWFKPSFQNFPRGFIVSLLPLLPRSDAEQLGQERGGVGFDVKAT